MDPGLILTQLTVIVLALGFHEFGHAAMSHKLGDPTPRSQGRLTLNPIAHLDPMGTVFIVMTVISGFGLGWGKPVLTNPLYYDKYRQGIILTALAGPAMNLCLASLGLAIGYILFSSGVVMGEFGQRFLLFWILINVVLMVFNLLPIPPLDGGHVLQQLAPRQFEPFIRQLQSFGILIVLAFLFLGVFSTILQFALGVMFALITAGFGADFTLWLTGR